MTARHKIAWTGKTWNPLVGCSVKSPGCRVCYAMKLAHRLGKMTGTAGKKYGGLTREAPSGDVVWTGVVRLSEEDLQAPRSWLEPTLIFVCSMSDLFHENAPARAIARIFAVMALATWHTYQVLTKRVERMRDWLNDPATPGLVQAEMDLIEPGAKLPGWPLGHVWCGTSVEDQPRADERIPVLLKAKAAVRFLSIEPLLKPVSLFRAVGIKGASRLDWVIVGGESGSKALPMHPDWARNLRDECLAAEVPFFFKQIGQWTWIQPERRRRAIGLLSDGRRVAPGTPGSVTMWNVGKKAAGNELDGKVCEQMPKGWTPPKPKRTAKKRRKRTGKKPPAGKRRPHPPKPDTQLDLF